MKTKALYLIAALSLGILVIVPLVSSLGGCVNPPVGSVYIDLDGDGQPDALAQDEDKNGQPDLTPEGAPIILEGSEKYALAAKIDSAGPSILTTAGTLLGLPILIGIGAAWKLSKFARVFTNTVLSVQYARKKLAEGGLDGALEVVDDALATKQTDATVAAITKLKTGLDTPSVSV